MTIRAPKGTDDFLPPDSGSWRRLLRAFDEMAEAWGYGLVMTPIFEHTELFQRGVGEATEVVEKQMYTFDDRGGRSITLRPEGTAGVVRAYLQSGGQGVFKGAYAGPMFRYEQPQAGRRRQFFQVGIEYLGEPSADADVEVIEFGYRLLEAVGIDDTVVLLNSIGDPADRVAYRDLLVEYLEGRRSELSEDALRRLADNPLRVLDSKVDTEVVAGAPLPLDHLGTEAARHHDAVVAAVDRRGLRWESAPRLVRGLDYYNRTVFEYISPSYTAAQDALGGGGRYDPLAELLGGRATPAVGLAMGCDRIALAMAERGSEEAGTLDAFVVVADAERRDDALDLAARLRLSGVRADIDLGDRSMKAQFRQASRRGATYVAIVGEEWADGTVTVRDMDSGDETAVAIEEVAAWLMR
jgi:histidyl-tRNA synthetase